MVEGSIPIDVRNPGQVLACIGLMEAAEVLCGQAYGGFDWQQLDRCSFRIAAMGNENPVAVVLKFLREARVELLKPAEVGETYPALPPDSDSAFPVQLVVGEKRLNVTHWCDSRTGRDSFKTFAGQQSGAEVLQKILIAKRGAPSKAFPDGKPSTWAFDRLFDQAPKQWIADPFSTTEALTTSFDFDARGAWDSVAVGSSLDAQGTDVRVNAAVELLAPVGLEHARPLSLNTYRFQYHVWCGMLPLLLARPLLGAATVPNGFITRAFTSHMGSDKYYKKCHFATEIPA